MALVTIEQLPNANSLTGSELIPLQQGGVTKHATAQEIADLTSNAVTSVNGETGAVVLTTDDIQDGINTSQYTNAEKDKLATMGDGANVVSVNGDTGVVTLTTDDIGNGSTTSQYTNTEKAKLAGIGAGANVTSVAGKTGVVTLAKADVGLNNVDNTSDANKPISTATQTALNLKYDASNPSSFVDAAGAASAAPVQSVNSKTGAVALTTTDVPEGTNLYFTNLRASTAAPVQSVNGLTGTVALTTDTIPNGTTTSQYTNTEKTKLAAQPQLFNVRNYGAIGDGVSRPLSTLYPTLAAAQVDYPSATALTNELDGVAIQKCLDAASAAGRALVYFPCNGGKYLFNIDINIPYSRTGNQGYIALIGDGSSDVDKTKSSCLRRTGSNCSIKFLGTSFTAGYGNALAKYLRIEHMVFDGGWATNNTNSDYPLMRIENGYEIIMNDVGFCQCIGTALFMREVMDSRFHDLRFNWCGQHYGYNRACAMTNASTTVTMSDTVGLFVGQRIYGSGVAGMKVASIVNSTTITVTPAANYTGTRNLVFEAKAAMHICSNNTSDATSNNLVMDGFRMESGPATAVRIDGQNIVDIWLNDFKAEFTYYALDYLIDVTAASGVMVNNGWLYADPNVYGNFTFNTTTSGKTLATALSNRIDSFSLGTYVGTTGDCTNGSNIITNIPNTSNIKVGMEVMGTGSTSSNLSGYVVNSIDSSTQITMNSTFTGTTGSKTTNFGYRFDNGNFNVRQFFSGMPIIAFDRDDPRNYMFGRVTYYDTTTGAVTIHVLEVYGDTSKSITNWTVAAVHAGLARFAEGADICKGSFTGGYVPASTPDSRPYLHTFVKVEGARSLETDWYATIGQHALPNHTWKSMLSSTTLTIGTGSKTLTIPTGLPSDMFPVNGPVFISARTLAYAENWMKGTVTSYNSGTGQLVVNVTETNGSGSYGSWSVAYEQQPLTLVDSSSSYITSKTFQKKYANPAPSAVNAISISSDVNLVKGSGQVSNVVSINAAQYALLTANATTLYLIKDTGQIYLGSTLLLDADLAAIAGLTSAADKLPYFTGAGTAATTDFTSVARTFCAAATHADQRTALGLTIGTDVQAYNANLAALAGLTGAANKLSYFTGAGALALTDLTSAGRTLIGAADAAAQRTALALVPGTNVQAYDAELAALAALSPSGNSFPYFTGAGAASLVNTNANRLAVMAEDYNLVHADKYRSGYYYVAANPGDVFTSNGNNNLSSNTFYGTRHVISAPVTIDRICVKTSSTNNSVGATVKAAIYSGDAANGYPQTLLAYSTTATPIGDSAVSTVYEIMLDNAVTLQPGVYNFGVVCYHSTTGARFVALSSAGPALINQGSNTASNAMNGNGLIGYSASMTQANFPASYSTFPTSSPTIWVSSQYLPVIGFKVV